MEIFEQTEETLDHLDLTFSKLLQSFSKIEEVNFDFVEKINKFRKTLLANAVHQNATHQMTKEENAK